MTKLITKDNKLFVETTSGDQEVKIGFESFSGSFWFGCEVDRVQDSMIDDKEVKGDRIWFGLVQGMDEELGYFSEGEIRSLFPSLKAWQIKECDLPYAGRR